MLCPNSVVCSYKRAENLPVDCDHSPNIPLAPHNFQLQGIPL
jgi:hypothetical protein